jgi:hypothetical protein
MVLLFDGLVCIIGDAGDNGVAVASCFVGSAGKNFQLIGNDALLFRGRLVIDELAVGYPIGRRVVGAGGTLLLGTVLCLFAEIGRPLPVS